MPTVNEKRPFMQSVEAVVEKDKATALTSVPGTIGDDGIKRPSSDLVKLAVIEIAQTVAHDRDSEIRSLPQYDEKLR